MTAVSALQVKVRPQIKSMKRLHFRIFNQPLLNMGGTGGGPSRPMGAQQPATSATRPPPIATWPTPPSRPRPSRPSTAKPRPEPVSSESDYDSDDGSAVGSSIEETDSDDDDYDSYEYEETGEGSADYSEEYDDAGEE